MLFNSIHFFIFFIIVTPLYFLSPHKIRWIILLSASCYFYMAFVPVYILILGFTIVIDFFAGIFLEKFEETKKKKIFLIASLVANISVLAVFKYYNFINENISELLNNFGYKNHIPNLSILLPIGLSFHTFQAMSYTIEVYRGKQKAERNFGIYALYVMFYPQLVAGPIERPQNLLHQFYEKHEFNYQKIADGIKLIIWGLFMKLVVADRLSLYVDAVYNNVNQHSGLTFLLATILFTFQIYCDFAGYSNIAIGTAKVMGFNLMTNFNRPYFAKSISEFWKRWHISLSTWFKDYVYIPLGGNKKSKYRVYLNLLIVFVISGLWHGANWTYIIWGSINGFYLVFAQITEKWKKKIGSLLFLDRIPRFNNIIQISLTFILICGSWVFFRAKTTSEAVYIIKSIISLSGPIYITATNLSYSFIAIFFLLIIELLQEVKFKNEIPFKSKIWIIEHLAYAALIFLILTIGVFDGGQFIYFQF